MKILWEVPLGAHAPRFGAPALGQELLMFIAFWWVILRYITGWTKEKIQRHSEGINDLTLLTGKMWQSSALSGTVNHVMLLPNFKWGE
jgi:hypothetical protein